ncbi:velvet complex subunit B [Drosophila mauritiana]|uniref:Velvet complex subunit B n=1 Tax=Drosophila mauritiana TaxID=7226 RepID=A0A6P8LDI9_DROMA|nr:velvet complex subunit B [Drosophila mauritiana]
MSRFPRGLKFILVLVTILQALNMITGNPRGGSRSSSSSSGSSSRSSYGSGYGSSYGSGYGSSYGSRSGSSYGSGYRSNYGSTYGSVSSRSYSPPSYSSLPKTFSFPKIDLGHNLPKGPPPAYSAHDTVGGAPTNIRERPPAYKPRDKPYRNPNSGSLYRNQYQRWTTSSSKSNRNYQDTYNSTIDYMYSAATSSHYPTNGYTYLILISTFLYVCGTLL